MKRLDWKKNRKTRNRQWKIAVSIGWIIILLIILVSTWGVYHPELMPYWANKVIAHSQLRETALKQLQTWFLQQIDSWEEPRLFLAPDGALGPSDSARILGGRALLIRVLVFGPTENNRGKIKQAAAAAAAGGQLIESEAARHFGYPGGQAPVTFDVSTIEVHIDIDPGSASTEEEWLLPVARELNPDCRYPAKACIRRLAFEQMQADGYRSVVVTIHPEKKVVFPGTTQQSLRFLSSRIGLLRRRLTLNGRKIGGYAWQGGPAIIAGEDAYVVYGFGAGIGAHEICHVYGVPHPPKEGEAVERFGYFGILNIRRECAMFSPVQECLSRTDLEIAGMVLRENTWAIDNTQLQLVDIQTSTHTVTGQIFDRYAEPWNKTISPLNFHRISGVWVCTGSCQEATPVDGHWDEVRENFSWVSATSLNQPFRVRVSTDSGPNRVIWIGKPKQIYLPLILHNR